MLNASTYINVIFEEMFAPQERRLQLRIDDLHRQNQEITRTRLDGFMYMGRFYKPIDVPNGPGTRQTLHLDLWDDMNAHLKDRQNVEHDKQLIRACLFWLLEPCRDLQEIRDTLPDCVAQLCYPEIQALERMRNPGFTLVNDRQRRGYEKQLPKMEAYSAARYIH